MILQVSDLACNSMHEQTGACLNVPWGALLGLETCRDHQPPCRVLHKVDTKAASTLSETPLICTGIELQDKHERRP